MREVHTALSIMFTLMIESAHPQSILTQLVLKEVSVEAHSMERALSFLPVLRRIHGYVRDVVFERPGEYRLILECDGEPVLERRLVAMPAGAHRP